MLNLSKIKSHWFRSWIEYCPRHYRCYVIDRIDRRDYFIAEKINNPFKRGVRNIDPYIKEFL